VSIDLPDYDEHEKSNRGEHNPEQLQHHASLEDQMLEPLNRRVKRDDKKQARVLELERGAE
jgi:hypothetical protein